MINDNEFEFWFDWLVTTLCGCIHLTILYTSIQQGIMKLVILLVIYSAGTL